jgi:hypothetical protein
MDFKHPALKLDKGIPLIYTAMSKHLFYYRAFISKFVLENGGVPLNPFMIFDYFLLDSVERDLVRQANNNLCKRCDEIWVFGAVSDGVLAEIHISTKCGVPQRFFEIRGSNRIEEITRAEVRLEEDIQQMEEPLAFHQS